MTSEQQRFFLLGFAPRRTGSEGRRPAKLPEQDPIALLAVFRRFAVRCSKQEEASSPRATSYAGFQPRERWHGRVVAFL